MSAARVELVVFDLDGTLFDHDSAARTGVSVWLSRHGIAAEEQTIALWFEAEERFVSAWNRGELDWQQQRRARIRHVMKSLGHDSGDDEAVDASLAIYLQAYEQAWRAFDDVSPALDAIADAGLGVAVLTNGAHYQQRAKLAACGLTGRTGPLFSSDAGLPIQPPPSIGPVIAGQR